MSISSPFRRILTKPVSINSAIQNRGIFGSRVSEPELKYHMASRSEDSSLKPVVLMIGWAGAAPKNIEKYTQIYTNKEFHVACICPPLFHYKVPSGSSGEKMTPFIERFEKNPIIIHSFSMNGIRGIISLAKATGNPKLMDNLEGIIFDSGPTRTFTHQNGKAMMLSRSKMQYLSDEKRAKIYEKVNDFRDFMISPISTIPSIRSRFSTYWYIHDKIQLPKRQLYFYSNGDSMVPIRPLEEFMETQKTRGCHVDSYNFGDSEHVAHFKKDPEEYKRMCIKFVEKI